MQNNNMELTNLESKSIKNKGKKLDILTKKAMSFRLPSWQIRKITELSKYLDSSMSDLMSRFIDEYFERFQDRLIEQAEELAKNNKSK